MNIVSGPTLDPHSPQAAAIAHLFTNALILCAFIFALVAALVAFCVMRFRAHRPHQASQREGNRSLEFAWTEVAGKITNEPELETKGTIEKNVDKAQAKLGQVKKVLGG